MSFFRTSRDNQATSREIAESTDRQTLAMKLSHELGVNVIALDSRSHHASFRVLGYTADSPEGVRRLVARLRPSADGPTVDGTTHV